MDRWTLVTPLGDYILNATFRASRLRPGGVDANAALRRDGRTTYQRSGDGLRTPGPLRLVGRVWRDDQDLPALLDELDSLIEAVTLCTRVVRATDAGTYTYDAIAGGPTPAIAPDGLGGWEVEIELWPGRPTPTFAPYGTSAFIGVTTADSDGSDVESLDVTAPAERAAGHLLFLAAAATGAGNRNIAAPDGWTSLYDAGGSSFAHRLFAKVAAGDSSDNVSLTLTFGASRRIAAIMAAYAGLDITTLDSGQDSAFGSPWVIPSSFGPDIDVPGRGAVIGCLAQNVGVNPSGSYGSPNANVRAEAYSNAGTSGPALALFDRLDARGKQSLTVTNTAVTNQAAVFMLAWGPLSTN